MLQGSQYLWQMTNNMNASSVAWKTNAPLWRIDLCLPLTGQKHLIETAICFEMVLMLADLVALGVLG